MNMRLLTGSGNADVTQSKAFSDWVLAVGDGRIGEDNDDNITLPIPDDLIIKSSGDSISSIVHVIYPSFLDNMNDTSYFQDRVILAPKNQIVHDINEYMLSLIPTEEIFYLSFDTPYSVNPDIEGPNDLHTPEFLNTIVASGLPNHKLTLKVGVLITLLRNIDQSSSLCNGTRLIITKMGKFVLDGNVILGTNVDNKVFIPRLSLTPFDPRIPIKFQRRQFSLAVSFSMTINKSQGQSLRHVEVYLPQSVFSHGHLYVAISRVTSKKGLKLLLIDDEGQHTNANSNVVYKEVFQNLN